METTELMYEIINSISKIGIDRLQLEDKKILILLPKEQFYSIKNSFEAIDRISVPYDGYPIDKSFVVLMHGYETTFRIREYYINKDGMITQIKGTVGPPKKSENTSQITRTYISIEEAKKDLPTQP